jgi:hypothetical protein
MTTFSIGGSSSLGLNFPGQQATNGSAQTHYTSPFPGPGSYNLMYLVTYPNGCTYSTYIIMSFGSGIISPIIPSAVQCGTNFNYFFSNQTPGNTYTINWGDGSPTITFVYPNLPLFPNGIPHVYATSQCINNAPVPYSIQLTAINAGSSSANCGANTSSGGTFYVASPPNASFSSAPSNTICQNQSITFTNTSNGGVSILNNPVSCNTAYNYGWNINFSAATSGAGYAVTAGSMGDPFNNPAVNGSNQITVQFTQPGTYFLSLDATNAACGADNETQTIIVNPVS